MPCHAMLRPLKDGRRTDESPRLLAAPKLLWVEFMSDFGPINFITTDCSPFCP